MATSGAGNLSLATLSSILDILRAAGPGAGRAVRHPPGNVLFAEGEAATEVHVIVSGAVKLVSAMTDSRDVTIGIRRPGWVLGVASAVLDIAHPCRAVTLVSSEIRPVPASTFADLVSRDAQLAQAVMWLLSYELVSSVRRTSWQGLDIHGRLELLLRDLAQSHGHELDGAVRIPLPLTHQDLADLVVASRESVSRAIADFRRAGRIGTERGWLMVRCLSSDDPR